MVRLAINGFGRIGRCAFKIAFERRDAEIIAINSLGDAKTFAHLLKYDSAYGIYDHKVSYDDKHIIVDGHKILFLCEPDPAKLPWGKLKIDTVMECTGAFRKLADAKKHLSAGARKVVNVPAPSASLPTPKNTFPPAPAKSFSLPLPRAAASKPSCSASTKKSSPPTTASSPTLPALPTVSLRS